MTFQKLKEKDHLPTDILKLVLSWYQNWADITEEKNVGQYPSRI